MRKLAFSLVSVGFVFAIACSSGGGGGSSGPCNAAGGSCPSGKTCWPDSQTSFSCLNSGAGKDGDFCQDYVMMPTCGDGLACLQLSQSGGVCTKYCNPNEGNCANGQPCLMATLGQVGGPTFYVCQPVATNDGGTESGGGDSGGTDSGGGQDGGGEAAPPDGSAD